MIKLAIEIDIAEQPDVVFALATDPETLPRIFLQCAGVPALMQVEQASESQQGVERFMRYADGTEHKEYLQLHQPPLKHHFRVSAPLPGKLGLFFSGGEVQWVFIKTQTGTALHWQYQFALRRVLLQPLAQLFLVTAYKRYLRDALQRLKIKLEAASEPY